ncbi:MAG: cytochrome c family protein, partial [Planctomycetota bacterium]|nr:cytochrome c family protein [Planctomycetota bacterium]
ALVGLISKELFPADVLARSGYDLEDPVEAYRTAVASREREFDLVVAFGLIGDMDIERLAAEESPPRVVATSAKAPRETLGTIGRRYMNPEKTSWAEWPCARRKTGGTFVYYTEVLSDAGLIRVSIADAGGTGQGYGHSQTTGRTPDDPLAQEACDKFFTAVRQTAKNESARYAKDAWKGMVAAGYKYVGAGECRRCHEREWTQWNTTAHAHAYSDLVSRDRWFYPQCVACHTTGFARASGFAITDKPLTLHALYPNGPPPGSALSALPLGLEGVQCEACHGPRSRHVATWFGRGWIRRIPTRSVCIECHTAKNSASFDKDCGQFLRKIEHK